MEFNDITLNEMLSAFEKQNISLEQICLDLINGHNSPHVIFDIIKESSNG